MIKKLLSVSDGPCTGSGQQSLGTVSVQLPAQTLEVKAKEEKMREQANKIRCSFFPLSSCSSKPVSEGKAVLKTGELLLALL